MTIIFGGKVKTEGHQRPPLLRRLSIIKRGKITHPVGDSYPLFPSILCVLNGSNYSVAVVAGMWGIYGLKNWTFHSPRLIRALAQCAIDANTEPHYGTMLWGDNLAADLVFTLNLMHQGREVIWPHVSYMYFLSFSK